MTDTFVNDAEGGGQKRNLTGPVVPPGGAKTESVLQPQTNFLQDTDALQKSLVGPAEKAQRDQGYADRTLDDNTKQDRARMDQAWRQERAHADDPALRPWNADQERANRTHGPMEQFGSIGMIFAMAASAFTRAPMTSALNAGAAAMTAIQQGDEKAYKSAYEAWKSNSDLALKRFDVEHTLYADADKLMSVDMNQWRNKTLQIATQFHDTKKIAMLNAGYDPEVVQARSTMIDSVEKMRKAREGMIEFNMQQERISEGFQALKNANPTWFDKDPTKITMEEVKAKYEVIDNVKKSMKGQQLRTLTGPQEFTQRWWQEHPNGTAEEFSEAYSKFMRDQKQPAGGGGSTNLTADRQRAADVAKIMEEKEKAGEFKDKTAAQVAEIRAKETARLESLGKPITSNRKDDLASAITRAQFSSETIDSVEGLLKKHIGLTGLGGTVTRPAEAIGNVFGSNETDRAQFRSYISELKEWAGRLLNESKSRPLASEEKEISNIVPGLNLGDTTANTVARLYKLQTLFHKLQENMTKRYEGTWTPPVEGESKPAPAGKTPWSKDPIVSP